MLTSPPRLHRARYTNPQPHPQAAPLARIEELENRGTRSHATRLKVVRQPHPITAPEHR